MEFKNHTFNPVDRSIEIAGQRYNYRAGALKAGRWETIQQETEQRFKEGGMVAAIEAKMEQVRIFLPDLPPGVFEDLDVEALTALSYRLYLEACGIPEKELEETLKKTVERNREMRRRLEEALTSASSSNSSSNGDMETPQTTISERSSVGSNGRSTSKTTDDDGISMSGVGPEGPAKKEKN